MASIDAVIMNLEKMPEKIAKTGEGLVKASIVENGHVDTGNMLGSVHSQVMGTDVAIWVWTRYAGFVNYGHGPSYPKHTSKNGGPGWLKMKSSPKWQGGYAKYASGYSGSKFFEQAYRELLAYVKTL